MSLPRLYNVFFAIPFDSSIWGMYERIRDKLLTKYSGQLTVFFGAEQVYPSGDIPTSIQVFKAQNSDLLSRFHSRIQRSDIVVADLTNNNANVHLELGIALALNKNILRVTGRNIGEVVADARGLLHSPYKSEDELKGIIENYLDMFISIKRLPLSKLAKELYQHTYRFTLQQRQGWNYQHLTRFRDGEVMVKFELKQSIFVLTPQDSDASWFGVSVRFGYLPWLGGYTVYVRKNGILEVARIQDFKIIDTRQLKALEYDAAYTLHVIIDGNYLKAWLDGSDADFIEATDLENQEYGNVSLSNFQTTTEILSSDTVSRDTLNFK